MAYLIFAFENSKLRAMVITAGMAPYFDSGRYNIAGGVLF